MPYFRFASRLVGAAFLAATCFAASAGAQTQNRAIVIGDKDSVLVNGTDFTVTPGTAKGGVASLVNALNAHDLGPGAIIFRSGGKLYIIDAPSIMQSGASLQSTSANVSEDRPNRINILYIPPKNPDHQKLVETLKQLHVLETLQQVYSPLLLPPTGLTIETLGCNGTINAWYNKDNNIPTVHVCYELLQMIIDNAPTETTPKRITRRDAIVGQTFFFITHELGHAVFDIYQLPVLGREEDAADTFAGYVLLQFGKERSHRFVEGAAYAAKQFLGNYQQNPQMQTQLARFAGVHGLPQQRFYNLLCLAYGADPNVFADLVDDKILPSNRTYDCQYEYSVFARSWQQVIRPHIDQQLARKVLDTSWLPQKTIGIQARESPTMPK